MSIAQPDIASRAWVTQLRFLYDYGHVSNPRGLQTNELMAAVTAVDMEFPVVHVVGRKLDYRFMAAEALWIISGSDRLSFHPQIEEKLKPYSDNGETLYGAYGIPFVDQLNYIEHTLRKNTESRQAVIAIWKPTPLLSKDIPCTVAIQFLIRMDTLYTNVFMRSSDIWMGLPYDIFSFTVMSTVIAMKLGVTKLGDLQIFSGSLHLYENNRLDAQSVLSKTTIGQDTLWNIGQLTSQTALQADLLSAANSSSNKEALMILTQIGDPNATVKRK